MKLDSDKELQRDTDEKRCIVGCCPARRNTIGKRKSKTGSIEIGGVEKL